MGVHQCSLFPGACFCIVIVLLPFKKQCSYINWMNLTFPSFYLFPIKVVIFFFFSHMLSLG